MQPVALSRNLGFGAAELRRIERLVREHATEFLVVLVRFPFSDLSGPGKLFTAHQSLLNAQIGSLAAASHAREL